MPAPLYFTVPDHNRQARKDNIEGLSQESSGYNSITTEAKDKLRELLAIPTTHQFHFYPSLEEVSKSIEHLSKIKLKDATGIMPYAKLDFRDLDAVFFTVNDGFGIPSELVVMIVEKELAQKMTVNTSSDILSIYLLAKISEDLQRRGLQIIRQETEYKAAVLKQMINSHPLLDFVGSEADRHSKTRIAAKVKGGSGWLLKLLEEKILTACIDEKLGDEEIVCFINYPAHSKEQIEMLVDVVMEYQSD